MADTQRNYADIITLLADNSAGDISPQDMRDVVATLRPGHGEISITATAATTLSDTSTWVQIAGTYALSADALNWAMTQSGRLYYTGAADRMLHIACTLSLTSAGTLDILEACIAKNGTPIDPSRVQLYRGTGTEVASTAIHAFTSISNGQYICAMTRNISAAANTTAETLNLFAMDMPA